MKTPATLKSPKPHRAARRGLPILEADIQRTVVEFLQLYGWRAFRTDPVSDRARGKGFGEMGMPDYLFIRYDVHTPLCSKDCPAPMAEVLWVEFKRPGGKPSSHQIVWHEAEKRRGALVMVVDHIDRFMEFYETSGLKRR